MTDAKFSYPIGRASDLPDCTPPLTTCKPDMDGKTSTDNQDYMPYGNQTSPKGQGGLKRSL